MNNFKEKLNQEPSAEFVKSITLDNGNEYKYLPIQKLHDTANSIFDYWTEDSPSIISTNIGNRNSMCLSISIKITGVFINESGSKEISLTRVGGSSAVVTPNNVEYITQLLLTEARKNAFAQFGKVFGRDLNRELTIEVNRESHQSNSKDLKLSKDEQRAYNFILNNDKKTVEKALTDENVIKVISNCKPIQELLVKKGYNLNFLK